MIKNKIFKTAGCFGCTLAILLLSQNMYAKTNKSKIKKIDTSKLEYDEDLQKAGGIPNGNILGYKIKGCHSIGSGRNICNEKDIQKILDSAKKLSKPNFDKDKKLVQLFYSKDEVIIDISTDKKKKIKKPIADTIVVDEKNKTMYVQDIYVTFLDNDEKKAPIVYSIPESNWFCLKEDGAMFNEVYRVSDGEYDDGARIRNATASNTSDKESNAWACSVFTGGKFHNYGEMVKPVQSSYTWLNKHGLTDPTGNYGTEPEDSMKRIMYVE
mgnify:CR=1 FL=1